MSLYPSRIPGYVERIKALGCEYIPTAFERRGMNPFKDMKLLLFYRRLIKTHSPAAVLTYTIKPNIYGGLAARLTGIPYLVNVTGLGTTLEHGGVLQKMIVLMYRTALKKAFCVFFQNQGNRDFLVQRGCVTGKTRVIPGSGVNLKEHLPQEYPADTPVRFVSIMRLMKDKGIEELLTAAQRIHERHPDTLFQILGAYEEETRQLYEPCVKALEEKGAIRYYGYRDDVPEFLKECQAVVHPSYHEGMSNVLLEAAATADRCLPARWRDAWIPLRKAAAGWLLHRRMRTAWKRRWSASCDFLMKSAGKWGCAAAGSWRRGSTGILWWLLIWKSWPRE